MSFLGCFFGVYPGFKKRQNNIRFVICIPYMYYYADNQSLKKLSAVCLFVKLSHLEITYNFNFFLKPYHFSTLNTPKKTSFTSSKLELPACHFAVICFLRHLHIRDHFVFILVPRLQTYQYLHTSFCFG